jgi:choline dehydrogenase-like flavoprotein
MSDLFASQSPHVVGELAGESLDCDIAIVGSGMGGATLAYALRDSGARVLVVERGDFLPREQENWSPSEVFLAGRYRNAEPWIDATTGRSFAPGVHYYVGGNTKVYGACLPRFREEDFERLEHQGGVSPEWPFRYADIERYYGEAERLYAVHGSGTEDPTEPWRSSAYPFPPLPHEPEVQVFATALRRQGLQPFLMPSGVDRREGGRCIRCRTCDGFPCKLDAKADADVFAMRPALLGGSVRLITRAVCERLETSPDGGRVAEARLTRDGRPLRLRADRFVVACGAVNSAALLLRSGSKRHPHGLANSSSLVGRNYMVHNSTFFMGVDPRRRNDVVFQKTLGVNDWYLRGRDNPFPLGNVQMLGKLQGPMLKGARRWLPLRVGDYITSHSMDVYLTTEDLPDRANFVTVDRDGQIRVTWKPNNIRSHRSLVRKMARVARRAGYPIVLTQRMDIAINSHQCGTAVMGHDPATSVLNAECRAHDVDNLWVVDSACFPSSAALNPALTIAANALRVAATGRVAA